MRHCITALVILVVFALPANAHFDPSALPSCWSLTSTYEADAGTLEGFGQRFGVELESLSNYKIDAGGLPLQVNVVVCQSPDDAVTVHKFFMSAREASPEKYVRSGQVVYEFLCDNYGVRAKIQEIVGVRPTYKRLYQVTMGVAPLAASDDMRWNALFNAFLGNGDVAALARDFEFSSTLSLRNERASWGTPSYEFTETPASKTERGDVLDVTFNDVPRTEGVPRLGVEAMVPVSSFTPYQPAGPVNVYKLTRATDAWPTEHPLVARALEGIDKDWPASRKIEHIACWVFRNIRYDGKVTGSRYGTAAVLKQGYGHCWDKSDVFVTLCRAAGVAARQVMGWLIIDETGHVWAQAYDPERGWISVDATASWTGVDERYIPLFILEDGRTPFVYTSKLSWVPLPLNE